MTGDSITRHHSWPWNTSWARKQPVLLPPHRGGAVHRKRSYSSMRAQAQNLESAQHLCSDIDYRHFLTSHLQLYPFTCQTTLNMSQKQNSAAQIQFAFRKSIYAQVLSICSRTAKWVNSAFGPGLPGSTASQKQERPVLPTKGEDTHLWRIPLSL